MGLVSEIGCRERRTVAASLANKLSELKNTTPRAEYKFRNEQFFGLFGFSWSSRVVVLQLEFSSQNKSDDERWLRRQALGPELLVASIVIMFICDALSEVVSCVAGCRAIFGQAAAY